MTKLQAVRKFAEVLAGEHVTIARDKYHNGNWAMDISNSEPRIKIPDDFSYRDEEDKKFRKNFTSQCSIAKGFSDVTLTLLHEFGHWYTRQVVNLIVYDKFVNDGDYLSNPYEVLATQWAICWLLCPANRQIAKTFERDFFGY